MKKFYCLMTVNLGLLLAVSGQENDTGVESIPPAGRTMLEKVRLVNPEKAKELETLRQNNPEEFRRRVREYIHKNQELSHKGESERMSFWLKELERNDPEKFRTLVELKETNPTEFRKKALEYITENLRKIREEDAMLRKEIRDLAKEYQRSVSDDEKAKLKIKLREKLEFSFQQDIDRRKERIEKLENYLIEIRSQIAERETQKETLIDKQLQVILGEVEAADKPE